MWSLTARWAAKRTVDAICRYVSKNKLNLSADFSGAFVVLILNNCHLYSPNRFVAYR